MPGFLHPLEGIRSAMTGQLGWMEKRHYERVEAAVKVSYSLIPREELVRALQEPAFRESTVDQLPSLSAKSATAHAVTRDLSMGGMSIVGAGPFSPESALEIRFQVPGFPSPITLLAEIIRVNPEGSLHSDSMSRVGVKIIAVSRRDIVELDKYLLAEKIRRKNEGNAT